LWFFHHVSFPWVVCWRLFVPSTFCGIHCGRIEVWPDCWSVLGTKCGAVHRSDLFGLYLSEWIDMPDDLVDKLPTAKGILPSGLWRCGWHILPGALFRSGWL
jgi:hypothetical protein